MKKKNISSEFELQTENTSDQSIDMDVLQSLLNDEELSNLLERIDLKWSSESAEESDAEFEWSSESVEESDAEFEWEDDIQVLSGVETEKPAALSDLSEVKSDKPEAISSDLMDEIFKNAVFLSDNIDKEGDWLKESVDLNNVRSEKPVALQDPSDMELEWFAKSEFLFDRETKRPEGSEESSKPAYIEFRNVYKRYTMGDTVINASNGVNFSVNKGELAIVLGASGAGKTTVLNMLGGIDNCDEGEIYVDGTNLAPLSDKELVYYRRSNIGFVFQFYNLIQNLTAKENVELAVQICQDHLDVEETIKAVGLEDRMDNFPSQLSGGEQQRVAIARALAKNPKLLLCDEPTGALDYVTGKMILQLLQDTCHNTGMTVVLITHNAALAPMADRVIRMRSGIVESEEINPNPTPVDLIEW